MSYQESSVSSSIFESTTRNLPTLLKEKNLPRSPIPSEVRWNSLHDTLSYFCTLWSSIVVILNETLKPGDKIYRDMEDVDLKMVASELLQIFQPISIALDRLQSDSAVMGDVFDIWHGPGLGRQISPKKRYVSDQNKQSQTCFLPPNSI